MKRFAESSRWEKIQADVARCTKEYCNFNLDVLKSASVLEDSLSIFITSADPDLTSNELLNQMKEIIVLNRNPFDTFHMLHKVRKYDDVTFIHSLNVAIICNMFGHWLGLSPEDLDILTLAGLLHDVGKMKIPEEIIKKPSSLTEEEFLEIKNHPKRGYQILSKIPIDERIKKVALMHHERCDGSGYPDGLREDQIEDFAKMVAIADMYDALTSARVYRGPLCPFEVIDIIQKEGEEKFDSHYLNTFLQGITELYLESEVLLSDGRRGTIIENHTDNLSRPIIRVGEESVDLAIESEISIQEIVSEDWNPNCAE